MPIWSLPIESAMLRSRATSSNALIPDWIDLSMGFVGSNRSHLNLSKLDRISWTACSCFFSLAGWQSTYFDHFLLLFRFDSIAWRILPILLAFLIVENSCLSFWSRISHSAFSLKLRFIVTSIHKSIGWQEFETKKNVEKEMYSAPLVNLGTWHIYLPNFGHSHGYYMPTTQTAFYRMKCIHHSPEYDRHVYFGLVGRTFREMRSSIPRLFWFHLIVREPDKMWTALIVSDLGDHAVHLKLLEQGLIAFGFSWYSSTSSESKIPSRE